MTYILPFGVNRLTLDTATFVFLLFFLIPSCCLLHPNYSCFLYTQKLVNSLFFSFHLSLNLVTIESMSSLPCLFYQIFWTFRHSYFCSSPSPFHCAGCIFLSQSFNFLIISVYCPFA